MREYNALTITLQLETMDAVTLFSPLYFHCSLYSSALYYYTLLSKPCSCSMTSHAAMVDLCCCQMIKTVIVLPYVRVMACISLDLKQLFKMCLLNMFYVRSSQKWNPDCSLSCSISHCVNLVNLRSSLCLVKWNLSGFSKADNRLIFLYI